MRHRHGSALGAGLALALGLAAACRAPEPSSAPPAVRAVAVRPPPAPLERRLPLVPGSTVEAALRKGESHLYRLDLPPGQFADVIVEQRGIDVVLRLTGPDGRQLPEVDSPNGESGPELLPVLGVPGPMHLEICSTDPKAAAGHYAVRVGVVRVATDRDRARVAAEQGFAAAKALRRPGDGATLRAAAAGVEQAAARFQSLGALGRAADARYVLGRIDLDLGEPATARPELEKALAAFRASGVRDAVGRSLASLATACLSLGSTREALAYAREAQALQHARGDLRGEATAFGNMARAQEALGLSDEARASYERAISLWRQLGKHQEEGVSLANRAGLFLALGEDQRALDDLDQALPFLAGRRELADALEKRGYLRGRAGRATEAAADLAQALDLQRRSGNRRGEAVALADLGLLWQTLGRRRDARQAFEAAAAVFRELEDHPNVALTLVNLGRLRAGEGDLAAAEAIFQQSRSAFVAAGLPTGEAMAWMGLAQVRRESGNLQEALRASENGLSRLETLRTRSASRELRSSFFASYQDAFAFATDTAMELHGREPGGLHAAHAFEISERSRARSLLDTLATAGTDLRTGLDPALRARQDAAGERLEAAEQRRRALVEAGAPAGRVAAAERELRRGLGEIERLEAEGRRAAPSSGLRPLTLKEIQRTVLEPDTVLLEYALGERRSFLWVVSASGFASYELPPRAVLAEAARRTHRLLSESRRTLARPQAEAALAELSRLLLSPAAGHLAARRLVVVPDGALHLIPFSALPDPAAAGAPLLANHEVITGPSASSLAAIRQGAAGRGTPPAVVAVLADPVFDAADPRVTGRDAPPVAAALRGAASPARAFSRLLFSREEARTVLALAPPGERLAALGFAARRDLATGGTLERFRVLHFATHAVADAEHPELSGIALSMVDEHGRPQNGFLRAHEIYRLRLPADLVVLSACETALGKDVRGEGIVGLTRAFLHAGARRVLVSLWPVEDRATADLMRGFYEGLFRRRLPPAEALRQAQDALRRQPARQAPHYWAGFELQGDWR